MSESRNALTGIETLPTPQQFSKLRCLSESRNALTGIETCFISQHGGYFGSESRNALTGIETQLCILLKLPRRFSV